MHLVYHINKPVSAGEVAELFQDSGIRRPVNDICRIEKMIENANLIKRGCCGNTLLGSGTGGGDFSNHDETTVLEPARR